MAQIIHKMCAKYYRSGHISITKCKEIISQTEINTRQPAEMTTCWSQHTNDYPPLS